MREHWTLDSDVTYLNHGAFGACPRAVLEFQSRIRAELEREPVRFFGEFLETRQEEARAAVASFVGARPEDLAFITNTTLGVSTVLRALAFSPGDEILTTNHAYPACRNALAFIAERTGARVLDVEIPLPIRDPAEVTERLLSALSPRVKLALVDHVTSPTGLVFPIAEIVRTLRERGVETLVDGAHAPGMVDLDVERIGAAYYVGNFHKWVCSPKGAAMLWVRADRQAGLHPLVISHGYAARTTRSRFLEEFSWTGSDDPSALLAVPEAIRFVGSLVPGGFPEVRRRNRELALGARRTLLAQIGGEPMAPESMIGSLAAIRIPDGEPGADTSPHGEPLHRALRSRYGIQVPIVSWPAPPKRLVRVAAQLYNTPGDFERLAAALVTELGTAS